MLVGRSLGPVAAVAISAVLFGVGTLQAADLPQAPILSTLVPVEDLVAQVEFYVEELEECVEDAEEYEDSVEKIEKCANTLAVIALTLGLHDKESRLQKAAPALIRASQELAKAEDFAGATAGVDGIKAALSAAGDPRLLKWGKVANLRALMDQVPLINSRMKRYMRRFERGAKTLAGGSAALVAISQGSMPNAYETEAPDRAAEWYKFCAQMRDAASTMNKAVHAKDEEAAKVAMDALQKSCDDCHAVFHTEQ
jgi:hypothetical protein